MFDSGVDGSHSEFGNRVPADGDWQGSGNGLSDPNGHGTHVASIVGAASDGVGMQGVAPEAELYSYRILDSAGRRGCRLSDLFFECRCASGGVYVAECW